MSDREKIDKAIGCFVEAMNTDNADIIPLAGDVIFRGAAMPEPVLGEAAVRQYLDETAPLLARMTLKMSVVENDNAALLVEFEGLNGPVVEGAYFISFDDGLVSSVQVFFDSRKLPKVAR